MNAEEDIPESVKSTLAALQGKVDPRRQNRIALFTVVALVSGWAPVQLFVSYAHRDAISATHDAILFPCGWGFGVFLIALVLFRKKPKEPDQTLNPPPGGSS